MCLTLLAVLLLVLYTVVVETTALKSDNQGEAIGHGYQVKQAKVENSTSKSLAALLQLIQNSSVYGPDIQLLSLTARYAVLICFFIAKYKFLEKTVK